MKPSPKPIVTIQTILRGIGNEDFNNSNAIKVYEQDKKIQGFVGMMDDYLAGIFVDKKCRSMGIGKELLECVKENYPVFTLNVYQKNQRAVDFYLREGLSVVSKGFDEDTAEADYTMAWNQEKTD